MVTAGVYLVMRFSVFLEWSEDILLIVLWLGGFSALAGALGGLAEFDIKRIIAYSTISQLGYMIVSTGLSFYNLALWHLVNHALFKALLFLSAGALIHAIFDVQDLRRYGSLSHYLPALLTTFMLGNFSIMAFPFFTGFYSKDLILEYALNSSHFEVFLLIFFAALCTALYSLKLFVMAFSTRPNSSFTLYRDLHTYMPLEY